MHTIEILTVTHTSTYKEVSDMSQNNSNDTAQTKSFGGKALAVTNGKRVLRLVQMAKTAQSVQAQE